MKEAVIVATVRKQKSLVELGKISSVKLLPFVGKKVRIVVKVI
jgi:hypothetical protein